jgi:opacity protein-like surface antigen
MSLLRLDALVRHRSIRSWGPLGAGLEWRVANHWSLRGEYLYLIFNELTADSRIFNPLGPQNAFFHHTASIQESIVRGAISYKY